MGQGATIALDAHGMRQTSFCRQHIIHFEALQSLSFVSVAIGSKATFRDEDTLAYLTTTLARRIRRRFLEIQTYWEFGLFANRQ